MATLMIQLTQQTGLILENMSENGAQNLAEWAPGCNGLVVGDDGFVLYPDGSESVWPDPRSLGGSLATPNVVVKDMKGTSYGSGTV